MSPFIPETLPLKCLDWTRFIPLIGPANAAVARYDGILKAIPNPQVLLSPFTTNEAVLSSRIEGTQATLEEVLEFDAQAKPKQEPNPDVREVLNYRHAMIEAVDFLQSRPLCLNLLLQMHATLMEGVRGQQHGRGQFRQIQNWIGRSDSTLETAKFVPPDPIVMRESLSNWENYLHIQEPDRLVQLAVIHAQFEIIHPFTDGNGRLGRMLIPLFLFSTELIGSPMFYMSAYFDRHRDAYFESLHLITAAGEWNEWVTFFLGAIREQAQSNFAKAAGILALYEKLKAALPKLMATQFSVQIIDALFDRPIFETSEFIERTQISKRTALRVLAALEQAAWLRTVRPAQGRTPALLSFPELIALTE